VEEVKADGTKGCMNVFRGLPTRIVSMPSKGDIRYSIRVRSTK
jgi:hypothetical protein